MPTSVQPVPLEYVAQTWPHVKEMLRAGLEVEDDAPEWSQCYTLDHVQGFVTTGQWLLVVVIRGGEIVGAITVSFANYPVHRVAFVTLIGGRGLAHPGLKEQFFKLLRDRGATKVQGIGRPSIVRLWQRLGFEPRATIFEAQI